MTTTLAAAPTRTATRRRSYRREMTAVLLAAFTLSVVHTAYAWAAGLADPFFTVTTPVAWIFYAVAFGITALSLKQARWAAWVVTGFLAVLLVVAVFYYPTTFEPRQQTTFGWFENDVYVGLLVLAFYLGIQRLRDVTLEPGN